MRGGASLLHPVPPSPYQGEGGQRGMGVPDKKPKEGMVIREVRSPLNLTLIKQPAKLT